MRGVQATSLDGNGFSAKVECYPLDTEQSHNTEARQASWLGEDVSEYIIYSMQKLPLSLKPRELVDFLWLHNMAEVGRC